MACVDDRASTGCTIPDPDDIGTNYVGKERTVVLNPLKQRRISYLPCLRRRRPRRYSQGRQ